MWQDLNAVLNFLLTTWDSFVPLYFAGGLFSISFSLWIVRKISCLIKRLA